MVFLCVLPDGGRMRRLFHAGERLPLVRFSRWRVLNVLGLFLLGNLGPIRAQEGIRVFDLVVCKGVSVEANGSLYRLSDGYSVVSLKAEGDGAELKDEQFLVPDKTTKYEILYEGPSGQDLAEATVVVRQPPVLEIVFENEAQIASDGFVCSGTKPEFAVVRNDYGDDVYWTVSYQEGAVKGNTFAFTADRSCWVTAQAANGTCPVADTSIRINVADKPEPGSVKVDWNTHWKGRFCAGCGFSPSLESLLTVHPGEMDTVAYAKSFWEWEEGGNGEKILSVGKASFRTRVRYVVDRVNRCGSVSVGFDTIIDLLLDEVVDCTPSYPERFSVKPCEDRAFVLTNPDLSGQEILPDPLLTLFPAMSDLHLEGPDHVKESAKGRETYTWRLRLENYDRPVDLPALNLAGESRLKCPYSSASELKVPFSATIPLLLDTSYLNVRYDYCPDNPGELEISVPSDKGRILSVEFTSPSGVDGILVKEEAESLPYKWIYRTKDPVKASNADLVSPLRISVSYEINTGTCRFTQTEERTYEIRPREDCQMRFQLVVQKDSTCMGMEQRLVLDGNRTDIVVDSIRLERKGIFSIRPGTFSSEGNVGTFRFYPYYSGAPELAVCKDSITATAFYRMVGSDKEMVWTRDFELTVSSCLPQIQEYIEGDNAGCPSCPSCPGTRAYFRIFFPNSTTDTLRSRIDWHPEPYTPMVELWGRRDKLSPIWDWNRKTNRWEYKFYTYYYGDTHLGLSVSYNEGDSVFKLEDMAIEENDRPKQWFRVEPVCALRVEPERDSCCRGDWIGVDIFSGNPYDTLQRLEWASSAMPWIHPDSRDPVLQVWTDPEHSVLRRGFRVRLKADGKGIYPFIVYSKVRDSLLVRADSVRLSVLEKARIFLSDTLYACRGSEIRLRENIDSSIVRSIVAPSDPGQWVMKVESPVSYFYASAAMRYECAAGNLVKDTLTVVADADVYLAYKADLSYCPGTVFGLKVSTNGRLDWYRQKKYPQGGYGGKELIAQSLSMEDTVFQLLGKDTLLYTVEARTACPDRGYASTAFSVFPLPVPELEIIDHSACAPDSLVLEARFDGSLVQSGPVWYVNGIPTGQTRWPSCDSMTAVCQIQGTNSCQASDTLVMYSYPTPEVTIPGLSPGGTLCVRRNSPFHVEAEGDTENRYAWYLKGSGKDGIGNGKELTWSTSVDTVLYLVTENGRMKCLAVDSIYVRLFGLPHPSPDTVVCMGDAFRFGMPEQDGVSYRWYDPSGTFLCPCREIGFSDFSVADTGYYPVEIRRRECADTQLIRFSLYPVARLNFVQDGGFCEGSSLFLQLETGLESNQEQSGTYRWTGPSGNVLGEGTGLLSYGKDSISLSDTGIYRVDAFLEHCPYRDSIRVRVDMHADPSFTLPEFCCEGDSLWIVAEDQGEGATYFWYNGFRVFGSFRQPFLPIDSVVKEDSRNLFLVVARGACSDTAYGYLDVRERPHAVLSQEGGREENGFFYACEGTGLRLFSGTPNPVDRYFWNGPSLSGENLPDGPVWLLDSLSLDHSGRYALEVEYRGCRSGKDTLYLEIRPMPVLHLSDTFLCTGRELVLDLFAPQYPETRYYWKELSYYGSRIGLSSSGQYSVEAELDGCFREDTFLISERPVPDWYFPQDTSFCERDTLLLQGPEGADLYVWQDGSVLDFLIVREEGLYTLEVVDSGCSARKSVWVEADFCSPIFFASAFTPNGDGINDVFGPITSAEKSQVTYALYIFNIWGENVFFSTDPDEVWDGTFKGKPCPAGIYQYRCKAVTKEDGRDVSRKGTVSLIR